MIDFKDKLKIMGRPWRAEETVENKVNILLTRAV